MSIKEQLTLASGLAVALASSALFPVFQDNDWFLRVLGAVIVVVIAGLTGRRLGLARPLQPLLGLLALVGYLCLVFAGGTVSYGLLPTGRTLDALRLLVEQGRTDVEQYGPPVPVGTGLVLLSAAGVGAVALLVDLVAVVLDRAALAGLPLLLLFAVPSAVLPGGLGGVPFVLGAIGWLGLLMVEGSERVGRWGTPMRSALPGARAGGEDSSLGRTGRRIGFAAVGAAVVLPLLVPGLDQRLLGGNGPGSGDDGGSHAATTYNPITRLHDQLSLPTPKRLFTYTTDDPSPDYLRMTTLDQYSPAGWSASKLEGDPRTSKVQDGIPTAAGDSAEHRDLSMSVTLDRQLDVYWLPAPYGPTKVDVDGKWLWDTSSQTVFSAVTTTRDLARYSVEASRVLPDRDTLVASEGESIDRDVARTYGGGLRVTNQVRDLTGRITRGKETAYDKAVALQDYFTDDDNGFVYSFDASPSAANGDALQGFLEGRRGFCEQYATAMAVLLRVAGIPSRVAVGFTRGSFDSRTQAWTVTTSDAHAWPEAWFPGTGWVRFEPTPAASDAVVPEYSVPPQVGGPATPTATAAPDAGPSSTASASARPENPRDTGNSPSVKVGDQSSSGPPLVLAPVTIAVLLSIPFLVSLVRRRRRVAHPDPLTAWGQVQDDACDVGHVWHAADSPRTGAARLVEGGGLPGPAVAALHRVALAAERARYARPGSGGGSDLSGDVRAVRHALLEAAPARVRLRATFFPTSTLRWATSGIADRMTALLNGVDDAISAVTRPIRRRATPR
jgi:transglutaminase-like putative cysteine protease